MGSYAKGFVIGTPAAIFGTVSLEWHKARSRSKEMGVHGLAR